MESYESEMGHVSKVGLRSGDTLNPLKRCCDRDTLAVMQERNIWHQRAIKCI